MHDETDPTYPESPGTPDSVEIVEGRTVPEYTQLENWVHLSGISSKAKDLYWALRMHVNDRRGDNIAFPSLDTLARLIGYSHRSKVTKPLQELQRIGAVDVEKRRIAGNMRARNRYIVHRTPPPEYRGPITLASWYAANSQLTPDEPSRKHERSPEETRMSPEGNTDETQRARKPNEEKSDEEKQTSGAEAPPGCLDEGNSLQGLVDETVRLIRQRVPAWRGHPVFREIIASRLATGRYTPAQLANLASSTAPNARVVSYTIQGWPEEDAHASAPSAPKVPPWCGQCDPAGQDSPAARLVTGADGGVLPCPRCHPRGATSSSRDDRPSPADQRQDAPASEDTRRQAMAQILAALGKHLPD